MGFKELIVELRRRRVFRAAAFYIVVAWLAVQVASLFFPAINVPESALLFVWLTVAFLFPLYVVFAWFFDITPHGIVRTMPMQPGDEFDTSLRRLDYVLLTVLLIFAGVITLEFTSQIERSVGPGTDDVHPYSIAVLPLDDLTGDPRQQYFISGMQAALIAGLSRVRALRVTSKTSTLQYRDVGVSLAEIGRQLGVARIVEGSVLRLGNRVRISVQLLDAQLDEHVWSATFEDELENIMLLQGRVAQEVAGQVRVTLTREERQQFATAQAVNADAYEAFLKGVFHVERFTPQDIRQGAEYFQEAVRLDPESALGHQGLGKLCLFQAQTGLLTPAEAREQCLPPILRALDIDPLSPDAYLSYASTLTWQHFDWERARPAFERAIELNPSFADAHLFYSHFLGIIGELAKSSEHMRLALELDPLNPFVRGLSGVQWAMLREYDKAIAVTEEVLESTPGSGFGHWTLAMAHHYLGNEAESIKASINHLRYTAGMPEAADVLEVLYAEHGYREAQIRFAEMMIEQRSSTYVPAVVIMSLFEFGGDYERGIDWIETSFREHDPEAPYLGVNVHSPEITSNPRYQQILRDHGLVSWADEYQTQ
jgi:TolB-like protein